jgi:hypothetical protein
LLVFWLNFLNTRPTELKLRCLFPEEIEICGEEEQMRGKEKNKGQKPEHLAL